MWANRHRRGLKPKWSKASAGHPDLSRRAGVHYHEPLANVRNDTRALLRRSGQDRVTFRMAHRTFGFRRNTQLLPVTGRVSNHDFMAVSETSPYWWRTSPGRTLWSGGGSAWKFVRATTVLEK